MCMCVYVCVAWGGDRQIHMREGAEGRGERVAKVQPQTEGGGRGRGCTGGTERKREEGGREGKGKGQREHSYTAGIWNGDEWTVTPGLI